MIRKVCAGFLVFLVLAKNCKEVVAENAVESRGQEYTGSIYQAALYIYFDGSDYPFFCGGSLISQHKVLTAAHCVINENYLKASKVLIYFGLNDLKGKGYAYTVENKDLINVHADFSNEKQIHDIAIIKLPEKVKLNDKIRIIELDLRNQTHIDETATVSGWEYTYGNHDEDVHHPLRYEDVKVISNEKCSEQIRNIREFDLCAMSPQWDHHICIGDPGGPLVANGKQIGIISFIKQACEDGLYPSGYVRLSEYKAWIEKNSGHNLFISNVVLVSMLAIVFWQK